MDEFKKDLGDPEIKAEVDKDATEAASIQLTGTPGFFINGRYLSGAKPFEDFAELINAELTKLGLPVPEGAEVQ